MATKAEFRFTLAKDSNSVKLETVIDGKVVGWGTFDDASQLDQFIQGAGAMRAALSEPVPAKLDPNPRLHVTTDPSWWVFDPTGEYQLLALRHPGFGWLGFDLPQPWADAIAEHLKKRS